MDMQGALRARLIAAADVSSLVGNRVTWVDRPQGSALPAITLQTISADREQHMQGFQAFQSARVQCDIWADSYGKARQITEAVIAALAPAGASDGVRFDRMFFEGERDLMERVDSKSIHRTTIDLIVWHSPA